MGRGLSARSASDLSQPSINETLKGSRLITQSEETCLLVVETEIMTQRKKKLSVNIELPAWRETGAKSCS